jgi:hypothetical protein
VAAHAIGGGVQKGSACRVTGEGHGSERSTAERQSVIHRQRRDLLRTRVGGHSVQYDHVRGTKGGDTVGSIDPMTAEHDDAAGVHDAEQRRGARQAFFVGCRSEWR